jgi:hypothetical protein
MLPCSGTLSVDFLLTDCYKDPQSESSSDFCIKLSVLVICPPADALRRISELSSNRYEYSNSGCKLGKSRDIFKKDTGGHAPPRGSGRIPPQVLERTMGRLTSSD